MRDWWATWWKRKKFPIYSMVTLLPADDGLSPHKEEGRISLYTLLQADEGQKKRKNIFPCICKPCFLLARSGQCTIKIYKFFHVQVPCSAWLAAPWHPDGRVSTWVRPHWRRPPRLLSVARRPDAAAPGPGNVPRNGAFSAPRCRGEREHYVSKVRI
jgi:hypothetical protein